MLQFCYKIDHKYYIMDRVVKSPHPTLIDKYLRYVIIRNDI